MKERDSTPHVADFALEPRLRSLIVAATGNGFCRTALREKCLTKVGADDSYCESTH